DCANAIEEVCAPSGGFLDRDSDPEECPPLAPGCADLCPVAQCRPELQAALLCDAGRAGVFREGLDECGEPDAVGGFACITRNLDAFGIGVGNFADFSCRDFGQN
ncbi:MAG: hypothetical protein SGILL_007145, partial [Bacillariaceae sp.]